MKTISRSEGRTTTAAVAYRTGTLIKDLRSGEVHDYRPRRGVVSTGIILPEASPRIVWAQDRTALWNGVEAFETRKNATLAREYELALPAEIDSAGRLQLALDFAHLVTVRYHVAADVAVHAPGTAGDRRNHHAHILTTTRVVTAEGFGAKTRVLDSRLTGPAEILFLREAWATMVNDMLVAQGCNASIDHRSHAARGLLAPTEHLGPGLSNVERRRQREARQAGTDYVPGSRPARRNAERLALRDEVAAVVSEATAQQDVLETLEAERRQLADLIAAETARLEKERLEVNRRAAARRAEAERLLARRKAAAQRAEAEGLAVRRRAAVRRNKTEAIAAWRKSEEQAVSEAQAVRLEAERQAEEKARQQAEAARVEAERQAEEARQQAETARLKAEHQAEEARQQAEAARVEAERQAEEARQQAEAARVEAERQAEEARQQAETARLKAEHQAEEARQQAEAAHLKAVRQVEEARQQAEAARVEAERQAEEARQQAETARLKAEHQAEEARQQAEAARLEAERKAEEEAATKRARRVALIETFAQEGWKSSAWQPWERVSASPEVLALFDGFRIVFAVRQFAANDEAASGYRLFVTGMGDADGDQLRMFEPRHANGSELMVIGQGRVAKQLPAFVKLDNEYQTLGEIRMTTLRATCHREYERSRGAIDSLLAAEREAEEKAAEQARLKATRKDADRLAAAEAARQAEAAARWPDEARLAASMRPADIHVMYVPVADRLAVEERAQKLGAAIFFNAKAKTYELSHALATDALVEEIVDPYNANSRAHMLWQKEREKAATRDARLVQAARTGRAMAQPFEVLAASKARRLDDATPLAERRVSDLAFVARAKGAKKLGLKFVASFIRNGFKLVAPTSKQHAPQLQLLAKATPDELKEVGARTQMLWWSLSKEFSGESLKGQNLSAFVQLGQGFAAIERQYIQLTSQKLNGQPVTRPAQKASSGQTVAPLFPLRQKDRGRGYGE